MFKILDAKFLGPDVKRFEIEAPRIAAKWQAGQFAILRIHEQGERIPLTIAGADPQKGTVSLIVQGIGKTTRHLNTLEGGNHILDIVGPLGEASHVANFGTIITIGGGVGTAIAYPTTVALKKSGNYVIAIIGARSKDLLILEQEMQQHSDELHVCTDDGSYGFHGFVTQKLQQIIDQGKKIGLVHAIGPIPMMKAVANVTRPPQIKTIVSLNPIMVDGTGMCGGCRVSVKGKTLFACVDGPEFDAHDVDFNELAKRNAAYLDQEKLSLERFEHECRLQLQQPSQ